MIEREIELSDGRIFRFHEFEESLVDFGEKKIYALTRSKETLESPDYVVLQAIVSFSEWSSELLEELPLAIETADLTLFEGIIKTVIETVESLKAAKKEQITYRKDLLEKQGFSFAGKIIESDLQSVVRIVTLSFGAMVVILFRMTGSTINWEPQPWTTADNSILMIDTPEMGLDMHSHLMVFGSDLHARATALKAEVDAITSTNLEEVRSLLAAIPIE